MSKSEKFFKIYSNIKTKIRKILHKTQLAFYDKLFSKKNKNFYNFISKKIRMKNDIPRVFKAQNGTLNNDVSIENAFNAYFYTVFNKSSHFIMPECKTCSLETVT